MIDWKHLIIPANVEREVVGQKKGNTVNWGFTSLTPSIPKQNYAKSYL